MLDLRSIDDLAQRLAALMPGDPGAAREDLASTFRATLQAGLSRLNLITREEFDVQRLVLLRTREKVEALEKQIAAFEAQLERPTHGP
ncbi:MAG: accessory factor UbiK family protein [Pseudomonadota bacterium]|jgi:BMFP domain-containing protein YqiC